MPFHQFTSAGFLLFIVWDREISAECVIPSCRLQSDGEFCAPFIMDGPGHSSTTARDERGETFM
jgi:hypothetical protein